MIQQTGIPLSSESLVQVLRFLLFLFYWIKVIYKCRSIFSKSFQVVAFLKTTDFAEGANKERK